MENPITLVPTLEELNQGILNQLDEDISLHLQAECRIGCCFCEAEENILYSEHLRSFGEFYIFKDIELKLHVTMNHKNQPTYPEITMKFCSYCRDEFLTMREISKQP